MKLSSFQIGLVSVILAVTLWLIATWFEDDSRWMPAEQQLDADISLPASRVDTQVRTRTDVASCEQSEMRLKDQVEEARFCRTDDDCTLFDFGYPIQCMTSVSKSAVSALRLEYQRYEQSCAYRVYYDCPSGEMQRTPICQNSMCGVELTTIDPPRDVTLQHLGIEER